MEDKTELNCNQQRQRRMQEAEMNNTAVSEVERCSRDDRSELNCNTVEKKVTELNSVVNARGRDEQHCSE